MKEFVLYFFAFLGACSITAQTDERFLLQSDTLPGELKEVPAVGNAHIATQVYHDTIYMNALMNGYYNTSHRARIPSYNAINLTINGAQNDQYTLDMYKGVFYRHFENTQCTVEQRIYAHRVQTRILVNEFTVTRKSGQTGTITVTPTPNQGDESNDIELETYSYDSVAHHTFGTIREPESLTSGRQPVHIFWTDIPGTFVLAGNENVGTHKHVTSISPSEGDALFSFTEATSTSSADLLKSHEEAWKAIWDAGRIEVEGNVTLARTLNAALFHILISTPDQYDPTNPFAGLSPGGLARGGHINPSTQGGPFNDYAGHVFWDMDTWILPPVMMLYPDKVTHYLDSRMRVFSAVKRHAEETGVKGVRFPWEQGWSGSETCPWEPATIYQVHVTADVSYALRQYLYSTHDLDYFHTRGGRTMALEIARFWESRCEVRNVAKGTECLGVMGPDEYHFNIDNSVYTNYQAALSLSFPKYLQERGVVFENLEAEEIDALNDLAENMFILFDEKEQFHPQFEGFDHENATIKQSDVVLLGYPLMYPMDETVRRNDLEVYEGLTDETGPDTGTWSMHTVGWLELHDPDRAQLMFFMMFRNINGPFNIFSEKPAFSVEGLRATNFITGAGGLLQSVFFGYLSVRARAHQLDLLTPYRLPYSDSWKVYGFDYRGCTMDFRVETDMIYVSLTGKANSEDLWMARYDDNDIRPMAVGEEYSYTPQMVTFVLDSERDDATLPGGLVTPAPTQASATTPLTASVILSFFMMVIMRFL